MHALHIALQEGFAHDEVAVSLDGAQVYYDEDVSTRSQGYVAASLNVPVTSGAHAIEVRLPRRSALRRVQSVTVEGDTWLGISLRSNGHFDIRVAASPFGYL